MIPYLVNDGKRVPDQAEIAANIASGVSHGRLAEGTGEATEKFTSAADAFMHHTPDGTVQGLGGAISESAGNLLDYFDVDWITGWLAQHITLFSAALLALPLLNLSAIIPVSLLGFRLFRAVSKPRADAETVYFHVPDVRAPLARQALLNDGVRVRSEKSVEGKTSFGVPIYHKGRAARALHNALG